MTQQRPAGPDMSHTPKQRFIDATERTTEAQDTTHTTQVHENHIHAATTTKQYKTT